MRDLGYLLPPTEESHCRLSSRLHYHLVKAQLHGGKGDAPQVRFHIPDEKEKRHGQAIAAASLPSIEVQEKTHAVA